VGAGRAALIVAGVSASVGIFIVVRMIKKNHALTHRSSPPLRHPLCDHPPGRGAPRRTTQRPRPSAIASVPTRRSLSSLSLTCPVSDGRLPGYRLPTRCSRAAIHLKTVRVRVHGYPARFAFCAVIDIMTTDNPVRVLMTTTEIDDLVVRFGLLTFTQCGLDAHPVTCEPALADTPDLAKDEERAESRPRCRHEVVDALSKVSHADQLPVRVRASRPRTSLLHAERCRPWDERHPTPDSSRQVPTTSPG